MASWSGFMFLPDWKWRRCRDRPRWSDDDERLDRGDGDLAALVLPIWQMQTSPDWISITSFPVEHKRNSANTVNLSVQNVEKKWWLTGTQLNSELTLIYWDFKIWSEFVSDTLCINKAGPIKFKQHLALSIFFRSILTWHYQLRSNWNCNKTVRWHWLTHRLFYRLCQSFFIFKKT